MGELATSATFSDPKNAKNIGLVCAIQSVRQVN